MRHLGFISSAAVLSAVLFASPSEAHHLATPSVSDAAPSAQTLPLKFATAKTFSSGYQNTFLATGDVNGDGHTDIVVTGNNGPTSAVIVFLGTGTGTFGAPATYSSGGSYADSVVIGDVNGDGFPDLVVSNMGTNEFDSEGEVSVLLGNGDGTFQPPLAYDSGGSDAESVALADVNGDGRPDLVVANQCVSQCGPTNGVVAVLLNDGKGSFQSPVAYSSGALEADYVATGDVNGDGHIDIVVANKCPAGNCQSGIPHGTLGVLINNGDGTFKNPVLYSSGGYSYPTSLVIADMNRDGAADVVVSNFCQQESLCPTGGVSVLLGRGNGTFRSPVTYNSGPSNGSFVAVWDVNGDGLPDIVANGGSNLEVLLGNGDGTLQAPVGFGANIDRLTCAAIADLNGDGRPDLIAAGQFYAVSTLLNALREPATTIVNSSANPVIIGQPLTLTATITSLSPIPDGTMITFSAQSELGVAPTKNGVASLTTSFAQAKRYTVSAAFAGDPFHGKSVGYLKGGELVTLYPSTTNLSSTPNPSTFGQAVTLTAVVTSDAPGGPTGKVVFKNGTTWLGGVSLSSGTAVLTTTKLPVGSLTITATYNGDTHSAASTGTTTQTVN